MSKRVSFTPEEKYEVVQRILSDESNTNTERIKLNVGFDTISSWIRKYNAEGFDGLIESKNWKYYSEELRIKAVESVQSGK